MPFALFVTNLSDDTIAALRLAFHFAMPFSTETELMQSATRQELKRRQRLKELIAIYALRTRRLSEEIAVLDGHLSAQRRIEESMIEVKKLSRLVEEAGADLSAFVGQPPGESPTE